MISEPIAHRMGEPDADRLPAVLDGGFGRATVFRRWRPRTSSQESDSDLRSRRFTVLSHDGAGHAVAATASAGFDAGGTFHLCASFRGRSGSGDTDGAAFLLPSIR